MLDNYILSAVPATPTWLMSCNMERKAVLLLCWCLQITAGFIDCNGERCIFICTAQITVDPASSVECNDLVMTDGTVRNKTCSSFQEVLNGLASVSGYSRDDCIVVTLLAGTHRVTSRVTIDQNVVLVGEDNPPPSGAQVGPQRQSSTHSVLE